MQGRKIRGHRKFRETIKRKTEMSKKATEIMITLDETARRTFKIAVDGNLFGIGHLLEKKRYNVL